MKLIKQTVIIANEDTKKKGYSVPEGFTGKLGYFLSEQELRELLENVYSEGYENARVWTLFEETDSMSREQAESLPSMEEYINNLLKEK